MNYIAKTNVTQVGLEELREFPELSECQSGPSQWLSSWLMWANDLSAIACGECNYQVESRSKITDASLLFRLDKCSRLVQHSSFFDESEVVVVVDFHCTGSAH
jgi:hypothetical protein